MRVPDQVDSEAGCDQRCTRPGFVYTRMGWEIRLIVRKDQRKREEMYVSSWWLYPCQCGHASFISFPYGFLDIEYSTRRVLLHQTNVRIGL